MHDVMWTEHSCSVSGRFGRRLLGPHFGAPLHPGRLRVARLGALVSGTGGRSGARVREHEESLLLALQLTPQALRGAQRRVSVWHLLGELHTQRDTAYTFVSSSLISVVSHFNQVCEIRRRAHEVELPLAQDFVHFAFAALLAVELVAQLRERLLRVQTRAELVDILEHHIGRIAGLLGEVGEPPARETLALIALEELGVDITIRISVVTIRAGNNKGARVSYDVLGS